MNENSIIEELFGIVENNKTHSHDDLISVIDEKIEKLKERIEILSFLLVKRDLKISALEDEIEELKI